LDLAVTDFITDLALPAATSYVRGVVTMQAAYRPSAPTQSYVSATFRGGDRQAVTLELRMPARRTLQALASLSITNLAVVAAHMPWPVSVAADDSRADAVLTAVCSWSNRLARIDAMTCAFTIRTPWLRLEREAWTATDVDAEGSLSLPAPQPLAAFTQALPTDWHALLAAVVTTHVAQAVCGAVTLTNAVVAAQMATSIVHIAADGGVQVGTTVVTGALPLVELRLPWDASCALALRLGDYQASSSVVWRPDGLDITNATVMGPNLTAQAARVEIRLPIGATGALAIAVGDAAVTYTHRTGTAAATDAPARLPAAPAFPITLSAQRIAWHVALPQRAALIGTLSGRAGTRAGSATQWWANARITTADDLDATMLAHSDTGGVVRLEASAAGNPAGILARLGLPASITSSGSHARAALRAHIGLADATVSVNSARCDYATHLSRLRLKPQQMTLGDLTCAGAFTLAQPRTLADTWRDLTAYVINSLQGSLTARATHVQYQHLVASNVVILASVLTSWVHIVSTDATMFNGHVAAQGMAARRKVKDKLAWRFLYDITARATNLDAGAICGAFALATNKIEGVFAGHATAAGFGQRITLLDGLLWSQGRGTLYFPDSGRYLLSAGASLQQQMLNLMFERLRAFGYRTSTIGIRYDEAERIMVFAFEFVGDVDSYRFEMPFHGTWLDALRVALLFK
jgi:hypothetical protein